MCKILQLGCMLAGLFASMCAVIAAIEGHEVVGGYIFTVAVFLYGKASYFELAARMEEKENG